VTLTARGVGTLAAFVALVAVAITTDSRGPIPLLLALGTVLLAAPLVAWFRGWRVLLDPAPHLLARAVPAGLPVGDEASLELEVVVPGGRHLPPLRADDPAPAWRAGAGSALGTAPAGGRRARRLAGWIGRSLAPGPAALLALPARDPSAGAAARYATRVPLDTGRRGFLRVPALRLWVHDPLGLFGVPVAASSPVVAMIHPGPAAVAAAPWPPASASGTAGAPSAPLPVGAPEGSGEFNDLRPYVPGDRLHLLDWPALARYGRLLVRRFDPEGDVAVTVVLDDRAGVHHPEGFEALLSSALGIALEAAAAGRTVEVRTLTGLSLPPTHGASTPGALLGFLTALAPRRADPHGAGGRAPGGLVDPAGTVVVTTETGARRLPAAWRRPGRLVVAE
jgi:hypothetical protein